MKAATALFVDYLSGIKQCLDGVPVEQLARVGELILEAYREERLVAIAGNGGSAATASHLASDLAKTILGSNPAASDLRFRVIALTDNVPLITAWANDASYELVFAEQLRTWAKPGDLLIVMSVSGDSPNIIEAVKAAQELGVFTIGLLGRDGGRVKDLLDLAVVVPSHNYGYVEDLHMVFSHMITAGIREATADGPTVASLPPSIKPQPVTKALVLAAGEGTRLQPLTLTCPKPMLPVNGQPVLESTIELLAQHGIRDIAINLHHCPAAIVDHLGDGSQWDVRIAYSYEDPVCGTAGAVRKLASFLRDGPFLVVYGDVLTDLDLGRLLAYHEEVKARDPRVAATMSLYRAPNPLEVGLVQLTENGRVTRFLEKPVPGEVFGNLANAGILVAEPDIIDHIPPDTYFDFGQHLFPALLRAGVALYGWVIPEGTYLIDIGTPEKYARAQSEWPRRRQMAHTAISLGQYAASEGGARATLAAGKGQL